MSTMAGGGDGEAGGGERDVGVAQEGDAGGGERDVGVAQEGDAGGAGRRAGLIAEMVAEVRQQQIAYDRFHDAVAAYLGVNRTDLRCLDILDLTGRRAAGEVAAEMGMSTGAVTALLDRMEKAGYIRRVRDPGDRRRVLVELTEQARERGWEIYQPFTELTGPAFVRFTDEQLATVRDFLQVGNDFYAVQTARIEGLTRNL